MMQVLCKRHLIQKIMTDFRFIVHQHRHFIPPLLFQHRMQIDIDYLYLKR